MCVYLRKGLDVFQYSKGFNDPLSVYGVLSFKLYLGYISNRDENFPFWEGDAILSWLFPDD